MSARPPTTTATTTTRERSTRPAAPATATPSRARGFALVSAIFLVVLVAGLAAMMANLSATQQVTSMRDELGTRAYFAARAGIEWGAYQVLQAGGACAASATLPALDGAAAAFTVTVACARVDDGSDEAGRPVALYRVTATAALGVPGSTGYAERQVTAVVEAP